MSKRSELNPKKALKNILCAFDEATLESIEEAKVVILDAGLDPDEELEKGMQIIKRLQGKARLTIAQEKGKELMQLAKEKLAEFQQLFTGDPKKKFAEFLAESGSVAFRKLESFDDEEALEMLSETELLKLIEMLNKESEKKDK